MTEQDIRTQLSDIVELKDEIDKLKRDNEALSRVIQDREDQIKLLSIRLQNALDLIEQTNAFDIEADTIDGLDHESLRKALHPSDEEIEKSVREIKKKFAEADKSVQRFATKLAESREQNQD